MNHHDNPAEHPQDMPRAEANPGDPAREPVEPIDEPIGTPGNPPADPAQVNAEQENIPTPGNPPAHFDENDGDPITN